MNRTYLDQFGHPFDPGENNPDAALVLTPQEWLRGEKPKRRVTSYRFVEPNQENRTREDWPYSYSPQLSLGREAKRRSGSLLLLKDLAR